MTKWRNLRLEFSLKLIFRIWMFRGDSKHLILKRSIWKFSQFTMVFLLKRYQLFFFFSKTWSDGEILALNFLSKKSSEYVCSEVIIVSTSFWMYSDENIFDFSFRSSLNCYRIYSCLKKIDQLFIETPSVRWLMNQARFCVVCRDMFLSTAAVLPILFDFFDHIVIEKPSVCWIRNQSRIFVVCKISDHMEYPRLKIFYQFLIWTELMGIHGSRYFHRFLFWI